MKLSTPEHNIAQISNVTNPDNNMQVSNVADNKEDFPALMKKLEEKASDVYCKIINSSPEEIELFKNIINFNNEKKVSILKKLNRNIKELIASLTSDHKEKEQIASLTPDHKEKEQITSLTLDYKKYFTNLLGKEDAIESLLKELEQDLLFNFNTISNLEYINLYEKLEIQLSSKDQTIIQNKQILPLLINIIIYENIKVGPITTLKSSLDKILSIYNSLKDKLPNISIIKLELQNILKLEKNTEQETIESLKEKLNLSEYKIKEIESVLENQKLDLKLSNDFQLYRIKLIENIIIENSITKNIIITRNTTIKHITIGNINFDVDLIDFFKSWYNLSYFKSWYNSFYIKIGKTVKNQKVSFDDRTFIDNLQSNKNIVKISFKITQDDINKLKNILILQQQQQQQQQSEVLQKQIKELEEQIKKPSKIFTIKKRTKKILHKSTVDQKNKYLKIQKILDDELLAIIQKHDLSLNDIEIALSLAKLGADIKIQNNYGKTLLSCVIRYYYDINEYYDETKNEKLLEIIKYIIKADTSGESLKIQAINGDIPLLLAIQYYGYTKNEGLLEIIKYLIKADTSGESLKIQGQYGDIPLLTAIEYYSYTKNEGLLEIIKYLIKADTFGESLKIKNSFGNIPLLLAMKCYFKTKNEKLLELIKDLIKADTSGESLKIQDKNGFTALEIAKQQGASEIVLLIEEAEEERAKLAKEQEEEAKIKFESDSEDTGIEPEELLGVYISDTNNEQNISVQADVNDTDNQINTSGQVDVIDENN